MEKTVFYTRIKIDLNLLPIQLSKFKTQVCLYVSRINLRNAFQY